MVPLVIVVAAAVQPAAAIEPIAGQRYRLTCDDLRDNGRIDRHFVQTTDLVFRREPGGWLVESTLVDATAEPADDDAARRFVRGAGALKGRVVRLHLDPAGTIVAVENEDAVWQQLLAGVGSMSDQRAGQTLPVARDPAAVLRALTGPARWAMIGSAVRSAVPMRPPIGTRAVTMSGAGAEPATLPGTETVTVSDGIVDDTTNAFRDGPDGAQSLQRDRRIDAATGLLIDAVQSSTMRSAGRIHTARTSIRLAPVH